MSETSVAEGRFFIARLNRLGATVSHVSRGEFMCPAIAIADVVALPLLSVSTSLAPITGCSRHAQSTTMEANISAAEISSYLFEYVSGKRNELILRFRKQKTRCSSRQCRIYRVDAYLVLEIVRAFRWNIILNRKKSSALLFQLKDQGYTRLKRTIKILY